jgi:pSer/pThr/pTyr-binding forkhead associated (FHA) protein
MPAHLLSLADGPSILIDKPILLFGRHEECDVQLNSKKVSRRHCVLAQVNNDYLVIRDLGSTNGVRINGQRVAEGKLRPGDELQIGNFKYQVCGDMLGRSKEHAPSADDYQTVPPTVKEPPPANEKGDASERVSSDDDSSVD